MDISQEILKARKLVNQLEILTSNPDLKGHKLIYDTASELVQITQIIVIRTADYLNY